MDVFRLMFRGERDLDLDFVSGRERRSLGERLQDEPRRRRLALEVLPRDGEEVAAVFRRQLLRREMPRRRREGEPLALLLDDDRGRGLRVELVSRDDDLVLRARVAVGLEHEARPHAAHGHRRVLAEPERSLHLQVLRDRGDDFGRGPRGFPLVQLLVDEEPLHEPRAARIGGGELVFRAQREGLRLDRVVVPEPRPVLLGPGGPRVAVRFRRVHHAVPDELRVRGASHALQRQGELALQHRRVLLPAGEGVVEERPAVRGVERGPVPALVGIGGQRVVDESGERAEAPDAHALGQIAADLGSGVRPGPEHHVPGDLHAELQRVGEAVEDVDGHVLRRRAARPPGEASRRRLRLGEPGHRRLPLRLRHARVEHAGRRVPRVAAPPGRLQPRRLFERELAVGKLFRPLRDGRVIAEERRHDAGRDEAVQALLRALVRVIDEVRECLQERVEELRVHGDDHLLTDERLVVVPGEVGERHVSPVAVMERDEARLQEVHAPGQDRNGPQLPVGQVAGGGRHLEGIEADAPGSGKAQADGRPAPGFDRERQARLLGGHAEGGKRARVRVRVEDVDRDAPGDRLVGGVVDDDLEICPVSLPQESRDVRPDHELLDALRRLLDRAGLPVACHGMHEHVPGRHRIRHGELDRGRAVGARQEVRLPESRLGKLAAQRDRGRGSLHQALARERLPR